MKSKHSFGVLLLFLCTIGFISCSDDDKAEYHLQLSENSCEVTQWRSVVIDLTTHENTTLDVANSKLIEVAYTWEFGKNKAKIEIKGKEKGETFIVVTDNETGESATINVKVTEYPMPRLEVEQSKGNIFDMMNFYLYNKDSQSINANDLSAVCDSIVWAVDGLNGSYRVFEHEKGDGRLSLNWKHCFKYPGEYKTHLTAWKDNKVISSHQLDISVTDNKDFLEYNWSDITKDSQTWSSYIDVLKSSPNLMTTHGLSGSVPYVEVRLLSSSMVQSYSALYDYFQKLYSTPTYEIKTEKQKMWKLYRDLFSEQKKYPNAYPEAIWVTEHANIALLLLDDFIESPAYAVYAEPKKPF